MKLYWNQKATVRKALHAACLTALLASTCIMPPARAQMAVVEAGPSLVQQIMNQINTLTQRLQAYTEYGQQAIRWKATWDHYQQQIAKFTSQINNPLLSNKVPFQAIPADYGVAERCGGGGGFSLASLARSVIPNMNGNIAQNQQMICTQIQMLENTKHNAMVEYVTKIGPSLAKDLANINRQRASNNQQGTLDAIQEASARLEVQQKQSEEELNNQIKNCDIMIASLTRMQQVVAHQALKGSPSPIIGTLVKTATLQAALNAGK